MVGLTKWGFKNSLDVFSGNSGSPIFNSSNQVVGIVGSGPTDFVEDPNTHLMIVNVLQNTSQFQVWAIGISVVRAHIRPLSETEIRVSMGSGWFDGTSDTIGARLSNDSTWLNLANPSYGHSYVLTYSSGLAHSSPVILATSLTFRMLPTLSPVPAWAGWIFSSDDAKITSAALFSNNIQIATWSNDTWLSSDGTPLAFQVDQHWIAPQP